MKDLRTAIRKSLRNFIAVLVLAAIAVAVAAFILPHERFRYPWSTSPVKINAAFSTAQAVTPGQGQTVRISGVKIGDIGQVTLHNGEAIVEMDVDPKYASMIHTNATALLRPKTPLMDMFVEIDPGTRKAPVAKQGFTIPIANTLPDITPDQVYSSLDVDTRGYLQLLVTGAGQGLQGRGDQLQELLARFEPTHRDLARFATAVATRRRNLRRLIHSLDQVNTELAGKSTQLTQLVDAASAVFRAFASQQSNISRAVGDLPGTLRQTTATLGKVQTFASALGKATRDLGPAGPVLNQANLAVRPFAREAAPILRTKIRPFVRQARPLVRQLRPASKNLATATPDLTRSFTVLNHLLNMVGYNKNGREDPAIRSRDEGYLYWIAWLDHDSNSLFSTSDANGPFRPIVLNDSCDAIKGTIESEPQLSFLEGLSGVLTNPALCG